MVKVMKDYEIKFKNVKNKNKYNTTNENNIGRQIKSSKQDNQSKIVGNVLRGTPVKMSF